MRKMTPPFPPPAGMKVPNQNNNLLKVIAGTLMVIAILILLVIFL